MGTHLVAMGTRRSRDILPSKGIRRSRDILPSRDTLPSKGTHLRDILRSKVTRLHLAATLLSSMVTRHSSMVTHSKVATPLPVTLVHLPVMVVAMDPAWVACSLEAQLLRLWLMERTRFQVVATVVTWGVGTWGEA